MSAEQPKRQHEPDPGIASEKFSALIQGDPTVSIAGVRAAYKTIVLWDLAHVKPDMLPRMTNPRDAARCVSVGLDPFTGKRIQTPDDLQTVQSHFSDPDDLQWFGEALTQFKEIIVHNAPKKRQIK